MADPLTTLGLSAAGAYVTKEVVTRLLGPTADFLGGEMQQFTPRRLETIGRIFRNAADKAQDRLDEPGAVPPRVLRDIVNEGSFRDDGLGVDYFGGVLASSRTSMDRDDRSATFTGLISRLSTYQIRAHYLLYLVFRSIFVGQTDKMYTERNRSGLVTFIPFTVYLQAMDFTDEEFKQWDSILEHIFHGLNKEDLIVEFEFGINLNRAPSLSKGIIFTPAVLGAELFLRAHGIVPNNAGHILLPNLNLTLNCPISILPGSKAVDGDTFP